MFLQVYKALAYPFLGLLFWISSSWAGEGIDPLKNFCDALTIGSVSVIQNISSSQELITNLGSRWYHQSQVNGDVLVISGGLEAFRDRSAVQNEGQGNQPNYTGAITAGPNNYIITIQMGASWDWKTNISEVATTVNNSPSTGTQPPIVQNAALFHGGINDSSVYLYGGVTPTINTSFPGFQSVTTDQYTLWALDTTTDIWTQYSVFSTAQERPSWGARAETEDLALAFYFNGMVSNESSTSSQNLGSEVLFLESMVVLNLTSHTAMNLSTVAATNGSPRIGGEMVYVEGLGSNGILVVIGGASGSPQSLSLSSMEEILIFDVDAVLNNTSEPGWYTQQTSGTTPEPRIDFCVVMQSAPDNSSYNIYVYGGRDPTLNRYYDEIWILSLPSFTWIHVYTGDSPRFGHTCHAVGNRQMITIGGLLQSNYTTTGCDWEYMGVAILEMSNSIWGSVFDANAEPYTVFSNVSNTIGGGPEGNATALLPSRGWNSLQLAYVMTGTANRTAPVPKNRTISSSTVSVNPSNLTSTSSSTSIPTHNSSSSSPINTKAIIGGICGAVALILILSLGLYCLRSRNKRRREVGKRDGTFDTARPKAPFEMEEMHDKGHGPYNDAGPREMSGGEIRPELTGSSRFPFESGGEAIHEMES